jgi:hypothetical protein
MTIAKPAPIPTVEWQDLSPEHWLRFPQDRFSAANGPMRGKGVPAGTGRT